MNSRVLLSIVMALVTGTSIAFQSFLVGRVGAAMGPARAGVLTNAVGGTLAALFVLGATLAVRGAPPFSLSGYAVAPAAIAVQLTIAGILGIAIVGGISFAVGGAGVAAGLSAVILAQLVVGFVLDAVGGGSAIAEALTLRRVAGIAAMAVGVWLLVPQSG